MHLADRYLYPSRRNVLRYAASGGALASLAQLLSACGGASPGSTPAPSSAGRGTVRALPSEMVIANELEPADLGPYPAGYPTWLVTAQIYETLAQPRLIIGASGAVEVSFAPRLATAWQRIEPARWRFTLRPGVTFHNGEPFDAAAAKFSFDVLGDVQKAASLKKTAYAASIVARADVVDAQTIDVVTRAPNAETLSVLHIGFSALPPKLVQDKGIEALLENPVGTGPYAFTSWTRGQNIRLEKFAKHWRTDGANMPALRYVVRREAAVRAQMVKAGEAHFAYNIGSEQAQGIKNSIAAGGFQSSSIRLNNAHPITGDVRVRKAINLAIDRPTIVRSIFRGAAVPLAFFGYQPVKLDPFPFRPDEARRLIDAAGVRGQALDFVYGEGRIPEEDQLAEVYRAELEAVGLKVNLKKVEPKQYNDIGGRPFPEQPPLYMETTSSGNYGEITSGLQDKYGCTGSGTFCKPEFDAEFKELMTLDGEVRIAKLQSIAERLHNDETPRAWVVAVQQVQGFADNVRSTLPANAYILFDDLKFI